MLSFISPSQTTYTDVSCLNTRVASPLVIEKNPGQGILTSDPLSPLGPQTYFDVTGSGVRDRISCVEQGAFLALPDMFGRIQNINQLFGNNTVGPDGNKAPDGYAALGKFEEKSPFDPGFGTFTQADSIFNRLVLLG